MRIVTIEEHISFPEMKANIKGSKRNFNAGLDCGWIGRKSFKWPGRPAFAT